MPRIGIIADDLTGATTTGVLLARSKAKTVVYFDGNKVGKEIQDYDAAVISSNSRSCSRMESYEKVKAETLLLKQLGIQYFSKRIDTTMRGNIGTEIDAMLDVLGDEFVAVVVPAMPQSRRILAGGYCIIDSILLTDTPAAQDVRTPVRESYIPKLLGEQSIRKVGHIELSNVVAGKEAIMQSLIQQRENGCRIFVADSISMENIQTVAKACSELSWDILPADPGPFTAQLAYIRGITETESDNLPPGLLETAEKREPGKTVLVAAGSATPVTKRQMEVLCEDPRNQRVSVDPLKLMDGSEEAKKEISEAAARVINLLTSSRQPRAILLETALHGVLLDLEYEDNIRKVPQGTCGDRINEGLGKITEKILYGNWGEKIAGIYATGGDTMVNICRALGAGYIEVFDYLIPQTDIGRIKTETFELPVIGKGGLTGTDDTAVRIVNRIFLEAGRK